MSATITLAKQQATAIIQHVNDAEKGKGFLYRCVGCDKEMIVVKGATRKREWHFRHAVDSNCTGGRDTALHDYAVQVIMSNDDEVTISNKLKIGYSNPRKEVSFHGKRSDVTVLHENNDVHFEIFVTHDLDRKKIDIYKTNKIKCVRIDLSDPYLLTASPELIKDLLLNQYENKTVVYWLDEATLEPKSEEANIINTVLWLLTIVGVGYLLRNFFRKKQR
ncbi:hypothetical protein [Chitinophaga rhizophila]|uniref:Competence protein CoiA-like protein n=1 Tax=Chitinophaga rhizophila TaxID=2866212 RepID=A0ABS7G8A6_9BACT|nr:hypothetical protein [Chitinophaga rhizophila]MBW8683535.1 hypothetical protein [Chitinophaga rhizophila]